MVNKNDTGLRLECLKLASLNKKEFMLEDGVMDMAALYYRFVKEGCGSVINAATSFKRAT